MSSELNSMSIRETARQMMAVSSPDCRCKFSNGQLVAMCSLCEIGAERVEEAMTAAVETAMRAEREVSKDLYESLQDLWLWASEQRTHLSTDPVPDGLGAHVLAALQKAEGRS